MMPEEPTLTLRDDERAAALNRLRTAALARPAAREGRQPVHSVYGGAHLFSRGVAAKLGARALAALAEHAPDDAAFAETFGLDGALAAGVRARVLEKLAREPVEDYRIDFEDGYGTRPDAEEDAAAAAAAAETAAGLAAGTLPPFFGIRIKALDEDAKARALRTLDLYLSALLEASDGRLPANFRVTLPKVESPLQLEILARLLCSFELAAGLDEGTMLVEAMVESPRLLLGPDGRSRLPALVEAAGGRLAAAHLGPYDLLAAAGIAAAERGLSHPYCDFARMQLLSAFAGTGVRVADGPTTTLPVGDRAAVRAGWRLAREDARRSLALGLYQGWDLHPAQLPARFAAVFGHFAERLPEACRRLRAFLDHAARATREGAVFDDAATAQGLLNAVLRARDCGAAGDAELAAAGLADAAPGERSFARIVAAREGR